MSKKSTIPKELILKMNWEETFKVAEMCFTNAERLHHSAIVLFKENYIEQAYNNLFISCEEYFKAKSFNTISYVKFCKEELDDNVLDEFIKMAVDHKWKFNEAFFEAEMDIPNITLKTADGVDDTEIQENLHKTMESTFKKIKELNPYNLKNNSLYVGFDTELKKVIVPMEIVNAEIVENLFKICFYIQMNCRVLGNSESPSCDFGSYLKWKKHY